MSEYTPTTEAVRTDYVLAYAERDSSHLGFVMAGLDFDRWLAAHDEQVRAEERERIVGEVTNSRLRHLAHLRPHEVVENLAYDIARQGGSE